jgi:hypothetical protein
VNINLTKKLIAEVGDLGDRMMTGISYTAGGGVINTGASTYSSPDSSQNPASYAPSIAGSASNITVSVPSDSDNKPTGSMDDYQKDVEKIKYKVTPDDIIMGINAELRDQVFKRVDLAKTVTVKNLKRDPEYYRKLKFLGIDDDDETVSESRKYMTLQEKVISDIMKNLRIDREKRRK